MQTSSELHPPRPPAILLVNGHGDTREIYQTLLTRHGFRVLLSASGRDAVPLVRATPPDVIVMEHPAVVDGGQELLEALAETGADPRPRVLIVTSRPTIPLDRSVCAELLTKPVRLDTLLETVTRLIAASTAPEDSVALPPPPQ